VDGLCLTHRTILPWMAQDTQYCSLRYIFGTEYSVKTEASEMSPVFHHRSQYLLLCRLSSRKESCSDIGSLRRTNSGRLDHVPDGESLDGFVLGCAAGAVGASDGLDVAAAFLVTSAVGPVSICLLFCVYMDVILGRPLLDHFDDLKSVISKSTRLADGCSRRDVEVKWCCCLRQRPFCGSAVVVPRLRPQRRKVSRALQGCRDALCI
jgi:hypothetical protein